VSVCVAAGLARGDGVEFAKGPVSTLLAGGGDCEDQTLLLCSMLETVGVKTYIVFSADHVFGLVRFSEGDSLLEASPYVYVDGAPCHALDPSDPNAAIGDSSVKVADVEKIFDVRRRAPVKYTVDPDA
jgi:transglutaminase-like putative cysteine protease